MADTRIYSVGYAFPGGEIECIPFESDRSLLDADIVIFEPTLGNYYWSETYKGKHRLDEDSSFRVKEHLSHWRAELKESFEAGKLVMVFLSKPQDVYVHTGDKKFSGTGRNQKVTQIVMPASSYEAIPLTLEVQARTGREISPAGDLGYISAYWSDFGELSPYEVTVSGKFTRTLLKTRTGSSVVGAAIVSAPGAMIFLPPLRYDYEPFTSSDEEEEAIWNEDSQVFGRRIAASLIEIRKAIQSSVDVTPAPGWSQDPQYQLPEERNLHSDILACSQQIKEFHARKSGLEANLREAGRLRSLLYASGKELESAILEALTLFGFHAEAVADSESEFDAVFVGPEGRFLGEAEGKDKRPINIDKLSQLERNIQEDFAKEETKEYAKGVLFGNPHRLVPPSERTSLFTEKCVSGARRSRIVLVPTPSLFVPAKYLKLNDDPEYATRCREAIANSPGEIVAFPDPPQHSHPLEAVSDEQTGA